MPHQVVVLLPFAQHISLARQAWLDAMDRINSEQTPMTDELQACRFMLPRFSTSKLWSMDLPPVALRKTDLQNIAALDTLNAQLRIEAAQKDAEYAVLAMADRASLAPQLLSRAYALAEAARAVAPSKREQWLIEQSMVIGGLTSTNAIEWQFIEHVMNRLALQWAASSRYATDNLFEWVEPVEATERENHEGRAGQGAAPPPFSRLWLVEGAQVDTLTQALVRCYPEQVQSYSLLADSDETLTAYYEVSAQVQVEACLDMEMEAQWAAGAVIASIEAGQTPVALVAQDRLVTRRIAAILRQKGLAQSDLYDETGWTLSTTRAATGIMALLRAATEHASSDALIEWLKLSPRWMGPHLDAMEHRLRREAANPSANALRFGSFRSAQNVRAWLGQHEAYQELQFALDALARRCQGKKNLQDWLAVLQECLQQSGQWTVLQADRAGRDCLRVLHFKEPQALPLLVMNLAQFSQWVASVLEAERFRPADSAEGSEPPRVRITPLGQLAARDFNAVIMPGCDAQSLPMVPAAPVWWTPQQRESLKLPSIEEQARSVRMQWQSLLHYPQVTLLYRQHLGEEPVGLSPLLAQYLWQLASDGHPMPNTVSPKPAMQTRHILSEPLSPPEPRLVGFQVETMSASKYQVLRDCPYQFYSKYILGLSELPEWSDTAAKKDWGLWLHAILERFHQSPIETLTRDEQLQLMDTLAHALRQEMGLESGEFLAHFATWPAVRDAYLSWLAGHVSQQWRLAQAEHPIERRYGDILFKGKIDRIDQQNPVSEPRLLAHDATKTGAVNNVAHPSRISINHGMGQALMLIDYKTESQDKTKQRVDKKNNEDIQLAFYAALFDDVLSPRSMGQNDSTSNSNSTPSIAGAYLNLAPKPQSIFTDNKGTQEANLFKRDMLLERAKQLVTSVLEDCARIEAGESLPALGQAPSCDYCSMRGLCRKDFWSEVHA